MINDNIEETTQTICRIIGKDNSRYLTFHNDGNFNIGRNGNTTQWPIQGVQQVQMDPLHNIQNFIVLLCLKVIESLQQFCESHTAENALVTCTRWGGHTTIGVYLQHHFALFMTIQK